MGKVIVVMSMSVDGFIAGADIQLDQSLGKGGELLHEWMSDEDPRNREVLTEGVGGLGSVITGRHNYDMSINSWEADGPSGPARKPVVVVSHSVPANIPADGVYTFVNGIEAALQKAQAMAGDKDVCVMGGANVAQQFINANLVDEIQVQLIPLLLGNGTRLFDHLDIQPTRLESVKVVPTNAVTHIRYRLVK